MPTLAPPRIGCFGRILVGRSPGEPKGPHTLLRTSVLIVTGLLLVACQVLPSSPQRPVKAGVLPVESESRPAPVDEPLLWDGLSRGKRKAREVGHA